MGEGSRIPGQWVSPFTMLTGMASYLVTGCAGFIGSTLARALIDRGDDVIGVDAFTPYYGREHKEAALVRTGLDRETAFLAFDLSEDEIRPLTSQVDGVFHLAAQPGVRTSWGRSFDDYVKNNLIASQRVFEAAAADGIRVVLASSSSIYGDAETYPTREDARPSPVSPYGVTKLASERLAYAYRVNDGLDVATLRYFTVYGPGQRPDMAFANLIESLVLEREFELYGGGQSRDFTFVDDVVDATLRAMKAAPTGATYNVGGGEEATLEAVIRLLEDETGKRLSVRISDRVPGDARRTSADTARIRRDLGWTPQTTLREGIVAQLEARQRVSI
jgi:UDP-glucuronate 4-epimerase